MEVNMVLLESVFSVDVAAGGNGGTNYAAADEITVAAGFGKGLFYNLSSHLFKTS